MNQGNFAQDLRLGNRRIVLGQGIASCNPLVQSPFSIRR